MAPDLTETHTKLLPLPLGFRHLWIPTFSLRWVHGPTIQLSQTASNSLCGYTFNSLTNVTQFEQGCETSHLIRHGYEFSALSKSYHHEKVTQYAQT